ncbi:Hypothetical predicted protein [Octopus vulgaris]|uniref:Uncharacterized protein n=1 Tax=Octopus vulgaris TaxID=6645 RepID=A0AA36BCH6_OCTVU|nr:Hypothetical predicted protein [Octopus vulgaris]
MKVMTEKQAIQLITVTNCIHIVRLKAMEQHWIGGFLARTEKSKGFKHVKECDDAQLPDPGEIIMEDGNAVFHCHKHSG